MKRIDAEGHISNQFTDGDPGLGIPATVVDAEWLNQVQEEISEVIEAAGITLSGLSTTQLLTAIQSLANAGAASASLSIANNAAVAQNLTGMLFDKTQIRAVIIPFSLHRRTDSAVKNCVGEIYLAVDPETNAWLAPVEESKLDADHGVTFSITSGGQLQYTSDNMAGAAYSGVIKISGVKTIKV